MIDANQNWEVDEAIDWVNADALNGSLFNHGQPCAVDTVSVSPFTPTTVSPVDDGWSVPGCGAAKCCKYKRLCRKGSTSGVLE